MILILALACLSLLASYLAYWFGLPMMHFYRYLCLIPIAITAYFYGLVPGILMAIFCCSAFLSEFYVFLPRPGTSAQIIELTSFVFFVVLFAYVVADTATSLRTHQSLSQAVKDWEAFTAKATDLHEITAFIIHEAEQISGASTALLVVVNPLDARWEMVSATGTQPVPPATRGETAPDLLHWLLAQEAGVTLWGLDRDPGPLVPSSPALRTIVTRPLRGTYRQLIGFLVLINPSTAGVMPQMSASVDDLVERSAKALEQAGLYARTDDALAHRVRELAAIQRTARQLNTSFDPQQIIRLTLECAVEIAEADAGAIMTVAEGLPRLWATVGTQAGENIVLPLLAVGPQSDMSLSLVSECDGPQSLLAGCCSRVLVPIRRETEMIGVMALESHAAEFFGEPVRRGLLSLADHAAIALENARLFSEIQREKQRANLIIQSVADGLFTTDEDGRIQTFNPSAERLTGWQAQQSLGHKCSEILACGDCDSDGDANKCALRRAIAERQVVFDERRVIQERLGSKRVISLSAAPLARNGRGPAGYVVLFHDITRQDETDRLQREFVAAFSHELRAPLTRISAIAEILSQDDQQATSLVETKPRLSVLLAQTRHLAEFADRMLDVFKLESDQQALQRMPLPIVLLASETVNEWQAADGRHDLLLSAPDYPVWVWADEDGVHRVLSNLLDNAIKYSPPDSTVSVTIAPRQDGRVEVAVIDQGPGIAAEHQSKIFDRFYRVDGGDAQRVYGHGLGLYIARALINKMDGQLWVESEPGRGCRFAFTLPSMKEDQDAGLYSGG